MTSTTASGPGLGNGRRRKPKGAPHRWPVRPRAQSRIRGRPGLFHVDSTPADQPRCARCGKPGGVHECALPVADDPSTRLPLHPGEPPRPGGTAGRGPDDRHRGGGVLRSVAEVAGPDLHQPAGPLVVLQPDARPRPDRRPAGTDGHRRHPRRRNLPPVMVMTAAAWEREFGRHPKARESAIWINGPRTRKVTVTDPTTGQDTEDRRFVGVSPVAEFDITQTEGPDVPNVDIATMTDGKVRPGGHPPGLERPHRGNRLHAAAAQHEVVPSSVELRWRPVNIRRRSCLDHRRCW